MVHSAMNPPIQPMIEVMTGAEKTGATCVCSRPARVRLLGSSIISQSIAEPDRARFQERDHP